MFLWNSQIELPRTPDNKPAVVGTHLRQFWQNFIAGLLIALAGTGFTHLILTKLTTRPKNDGEHSLESKSDTET